MTEYLVSGLVEGYRIEKTVSAVSLHHAHSYFRKHVFQRSERLRS